MDEVFFYIMKKTLIRQTVVELIRDRTVQTLLLLKLVNHFLNLQCHKYSLRTLPMTWKKKLQHPPPVLLSQNVVVSTLTHTIVFVYL